jgi:hypothetical protein
VDHGINLVYDTTYVAKVHINLYDKNAVIHVDKIVSAEPCVYPITISECYTQTRYGNYDDSDSDDDAKERDKGIIKTTNNKTLYRDIQFRVKASELQHMYQLEFFGNVYEHVLKQFENHFDSYQLVSNYTSEDHLMFHCGSKKEKVEMDKTYTATVLFQVQKNDNVRIITPYILSIN